MKLRALGGGLLLAGAATAGALLLAEAGLRLAAPQPLLHDPDAFLPDPLLGARLKPGFADRVVTTEFASTWRINAAGHRGPQAGERGSAACRIVALGDSFTFGYGVEEEQAWPRLLEEIQNRGADGASGRVEVLNLGVGGYGTWQEALKLEQAREEMRPDLALVAFYVGNDPDDNARALGDPGALSEGGGGGPAPATPARAERLKRWLGSRLHLYSFVATRADELLVRAGLRQLVYPFEMQILLPREPPEVSRGWEATRAAFSRLAALDRELNPKILVIVIPMKHQVSDRFWQRVTTHYRGVAGDQPWDRDRPQRIVRDLCRETGLSCLDLLEGLREAGRAAGDGAALYWPRDQHWNARGHAEAVRLIARELEALLDARGPATGSGSE